MTTAISEDLRARRSQIVTQHIDAENRHDPDGVVQGLEEFPGVAAVSPPLQNEAGDVTLVSVTPTTAPASASTKASSGSKSA